MRVPQRASSADIFFGEPNARRFLLRYSRRPTDRPTDRPADRPMSQPPTDRSSDQPTDRPTDPEMVQALPLTVRGGRSDRPRRTGWPIRAKRARQHGRASRVFINHNSHIQSRLDGRRIEAALAAVAAAAVTAAVPAAAAAAGRSNDRSSCSGSRGSSVRQLLSFVTP